jgi:xylulokinase
MTAAAGRARPEDAEDAPVFIPHTAAERGPLWLREAHTALLGMLPHTTAESAAWGITEGVAFASRLVLEMCTEGRLAPHDPVYMAGTFAAGDAYPQVVADALGRPVRLVAESHLPAVGAAAMAAASVDGVALPRPDARLVEPRPEWTATVDRRWRRFARQWSGVVDRPFPVDIPDADAGSLTAADLLTASPS